MSDDTSVLDDLAQRDDEMLVLRDSGGREAHLAGGPDYFASFIDDDSPGPKREPIARDTAASMVSGWDVVGFESAPEGFAPPDWVRDYPTTTFRGPTLYPVPEDWVLGPVEGGAIGWKRYADAPNAQDAESEHDIADDIRREGATDEAVLFSEWTEHDETLQELSFNYEDTAFEDVVVENRAELWAVTAKALARFARGEDYADVSFASGKPPKPVREEQRRQRELEQKREANQSITSFGETDE